MNNVPNQAVCLLQHDMDIIKVEPDSDEERHPVSSHNAYYMTDGKQNYPVHAEFFVVKSETEVSSMYKTA